MATLPRSALVSAACLAMGLSACHPRVPLAVSVAPQPAEPAAEHTGLTYEIARVIDSDFGLPLAIDVARGRAFTVSERETLRYWDLTTGRMLAEHSAQGSFDSAMYSADSSRVALARSDRVSVWQLADGARVGSWDTPVAFMDLSADGRWLATASPEGQVSVWATDTGEFVGQWTGPSSYRLEFGQQGTRLLGIPVPGSQCCRDKAAILWSVPDGRELARIADADGMRGPYVLARGNDVEVWRAEDGQHWLTMTGRELAITPDARIGVTEVSSIIRRYSLADRKLLSQVDLGGSIGLGDRALAPDGSLLAFQTETNTQVWDLDAGKPRHVLGRARDLQFSDDGSSLRMRRVGHSLVVLDVDDGSLLETPLTGYLWPLSEHTAYASSGRGIVRWSRDDDRVSAPMAERLSLDGAWLSASGERIVGWFRGGVSVWDADTGERLDRCDGLHSPGPVRWLNGNRVLVNDGGNAFVVELATCERSDPSGTSTDDYRHSSMSLALSPDGHGIAVPTTDGLRVFGLGGSVSMPDTQFVTAVDWAPGDLFAVAGDDVIRVLTSHGRPVGELGRGPLPEPGGVGSAYGNSLLGSDAPSWSGDWHDVAFDGEGRVAAVDGYRLALFDVHTGQRQATVELDLPSNYEAWVSFDPTGRWLAVSLTSFGELLCVRVYAIPDLALAWSHGRLRDAHEMSPNPERGSSVAWHPRGRSLVVTMREHDNRPGPALLVEPGTWKVDALDIHADEGWLGTPSFSADGRRLLIPQGKDRLIVLDESR